MEKTAKTEFPLADGIRRRWSPRAFSDHLLSRDEIGSLFEAARWAPSAHNEQRGRFLFARRCDEDAFARLIACRVPWNQTWARHAALVILTFTATRFERNDRENAWAGHDLGLATENLILQAQSFGLRAHVMAGIDADAIRSSYEIPEGYAPFTAIAVGALGDPADLPDDMEEQELAPRTRKPLDDIVFEGAWGDAADFPRRKGLRR